MIDLDELRKLAEAATPGPWLIESVREEDDAGSYSVHGIKDVAPTRWYSDSDMAHTALDTLDYSDAEFIAAANPQVVLELIERMREAEAERDAALAAVERVRAAKCEVDSVHHIHGADCLCGFSSARSRSRTEHITEAILAALDGAPEPEDVWEYGYELIEPDDRNVFEREGDFISAAFAYRAARKRIHEERHPDVPSLQYAIIRRRKAGPWLPVEGESK